MSHRSLGSRMRLMAAVVVAAAGAVLAVPVGSQEIVVPRQVVQSHFPAGTVVLYFTIESSGETVLKLEVRCAGRDFSLVEENRANDKSYSFSCRLGGEVRVQGDSGAQILIDIKQGSFEHRTESARLSLNNIRVSAVLASGTEKVLLKTDDMVFRVRAVFEPGD